MSTQKFANLSITLNGRFIHQSGDIQGRKLSAGGRESDSLRLQSEE